LAQQTNIENRAFWPLFRCHSPWLSWPVLPDSRTGTLVSVLAQLEQSQWYTPQKLEEMQKLQLAKLLEYTTHHSPFYRKLMGNAHGLWQLQDMPLLSRDDLQKHFSEINCTTIPREHGGFNETKSSGSTGRMVTVRRTEACMMFWLALTLREHLWHQRDFSRTMAVIRPTVAEGDTARKGLSMKDWGAPVSLLFDSGNAFALNLQTDIARQAEWLTSINPHYLLTFPTNLAELIKYFEAHGTSLSNLQEVRTVGESVSETLRKQCKTSWGVDIADTYSSQELGVIAIQCPTSGMYHAMSENLIVEVIHDDGQPCQQGEVGRVVVTDLHNFATPLVRYDTKDYAEVGGSCPCGRGLPTLARILGRSRNMVVLPDGQRFWPLVGAYQFREIAPISQYQVIQKTLTQLEVRMVAERKVSVQEEMELASVIQRSLDYPFEMTFLYFDLEIPRGKSGKFEEFLCEIENDA